MQETVLLISLPNSVVITSMVRALTSVPGGPSLQIFPTCTLPSSLPHNPVLAELGSPFLGEADRSASLHSHSGVPGSPPFTRDQGILGECGPAPSGFSRLPSPSKGGRLWRGQQRPGPVTLRAALGIGSLQHRCCLLLPRRMPPPPPAGVARKVGGESRPDLPVLGGHGWLLPHRVPSP